MSEELPLVSLCTPTFNRRRYIPMVIRCIELQDYPKDKMEWIIVNDGDEEIEDILNEASKTNNLPKIRYYRYKRDKPIILGEKRNLCNYYAKGDIIVNIDDDDYYPPERVSHAVNILINSPNVYCAGSNVLYNYFKNYEMIGAIGPTSINHCFSGTLAFKKDLLKITNYNNEDISAEEGKFLLNLNLPVIQLDPCKTILSLSHETNLSGRSKFVESYNTCILENKKIEDFIKDEYIINLFTQ
uniref:Glycosyltransferase 2-like domain-containing protein n=1 Tax=viral metagenome TaxID=1070528 RepID=A0A6C0AVM2_9ZZZZ|tara:strand:+ start:40307 stop:41032 length:726 start_codon:yes stop_codon:yes gene_type:complete